MARDVEDLLSRTRGRDESATEKLVSTFRPIATAEAFRACGDRDMAEDAAQEALIRALDNVHRLRKPERFGEWLGTIARNEGHARLRRRKDALVDAATLEPGPELTPASALPGAEEELHGSDATRLAREAMARLPSRLRRVLQLRYFEGCSYQEIARELRIPVTTAKGRLQMARDLFREWYDELDACEFCQEHLDTFLAGRLPFDDAWEVYEHVFHCEHCTQRMLDLSAIRAEALIPTISHWNLGIADMWMRLPWELPRLQRRLQERVERHPHRALPWMQLHSALGPPGGRSQYEGIAAKAEPESPAGLVAHLTLVPLEHMARQMVKRFWRRPSRAVIYEQMWLASYAIKTGDMALGEHLLEVALANLRCRAGGPSPGGLASARSLPSGGDGERMATVIGAIEPLIDDPSPLMTLHLVQMLFWGIGWLSEQHSVLSRRNWASAPAGLDRLSTIIPEWLRSGDLAKASRAIDAVMASLRLRPSRLHHGDFGNVIPLLAESGRLRDASRHAAEYVVWLRGDDDRRAAIGVSIDDRILALAEGKLPPKQLPAEAGKPRPR